VAGGGEGATRFPAWRRWEAWGKREVGGCGRGEQAAAAACIVAGGGGGHWRRPRGGQRPKAVWELAVGRWTGGGGE